MKLEQSFEVAAPLERVWEALVDVERVAPCLPGASVTGRNDDGSYNGEFKVKVGPTSAAYAGKLNMQAVDADAHRATMTAAGSDTRGQGGAKATIVSTLTAAPDGQTRVEVSTDYQITGRLARFGRGGMIEAISTRLLGEFASNLQSMLAGGAPADGAEPAPDAATAADEPATVAHEPATVAHEPAAPASASTAPPSTAGDSSTGSSSEPLSAGSLVGSAMLGQVKANLTPVIGVVLGLLVALRRRRRRS